MAKVTAAQVKELRTKTGVGIMDAKKALVKVDGDIEKAIDFLREKGIAKAAKKSDRVAAEGLADVETVNNTTAVVEVNAETDFVAQNAKFKDLVKLIATAIAENKPADVAAALELTVEGHTINDRIIEATQVIGEKITLRRFTLIESAANQSVGSYLHMGGKIAAVVVLDGADAATAKDVAMHVAAINPKYLNRDQVPAAELEHEKEVLKQEALNEGKPEKIVEKMVVGRLNKYLSEISLADQEFVKDPDQTVAKYVASKNGKLVSFTRFEVGEGIEKKTDNFAEEVMSQIKD